MEKENMDGEQKTEFKLTEVNTENLKDVKEQIGKIIEEISKPLFEKPPKEQKEDEEDIDEDDELDEDDDEVMSGIEQKMAAEIKKRLDADLKGNWNTLVGNRFTHLINLLAKDRWGSFKYGNTNILVFEMNNI